MSGVDSNQKTGNSVDVATTAADDDSKLKVCTYYSLIVIALSAGQYRSNTKTPFSR